MKRFIAILLVASFLFVLPVEAMAKSKKMDADVPVWTEETVRQYVLDFVEGNKMAELYSYYDLQVRRYMPEFTYEKMLTELEWLTGGFICLGDYTCLEEGARNSKTHIIHMHMEKQDLDVYFTHKDYEDDWEVMAVEFVPAAKEEIDVGFSVDAQPEVSASFEEIPVVVNEGTDVALNGILTLPAGLAAGQKVPACVLIHDEGPLDMNAAVGQTRFFEHLAQELADAGVASIRYDKRTFVYGDDPSITVYDEVVADALAAAALLAANENVDANAIVAVGHGFGAYVTPYVAMESAGTIKGMILIGSRPVSYVDQVMEKTDLSQLSRDERNDLSELVRNLRRRSEEELAGVQLFGRDARYYWELEQYAPVTLISNLALPTYIVQGRNDAGVTENDGWRAWQEELKNYGQYCDYQSYRGLNHMLANDLSVDENGVPQYDVDAGIEVTAVRDLAQWIMKLMPEAENAEVAQ